MPESLTRLATPNLIRQGVKTFDRYERESIRNAEDITIFERIASWQVPGLG